MATIGVGAGSYIRPADIKRVRTQRWRVDASQTVLVGSLMVLSADANEGDRLKVADDPTTDRFVVGIAAQALTTSASPTYPTDEIIVWMATGETEFVGHVSSGASNGTLDNNDISVEYGLYVDATNNIMRVDLSETSAKLVRILRLKDAHGDVNGRVIFHFIAPERLVND